MARRRKRVVATTGLGVMVCARGEAAKIITEDINNPNISQQVLLKSHEVSKTITPIKLKK